MNEIQGLHHVERITSRLDFGFQAKFIPVILARRSSDLLSILWCDGNYNFSSTALLSLLELNVDAQRLILKNKAL